MLETLLLESCAQRGIEEPIENHEAECSAPAMAPVGAAARPKAKPQS